MTMATDRSLSDSKSSSESKSDPLRQIALGSEHAHLSELKKVVSVLCTEVNQLIIIYELASLLCNYFFSMLRNEMI
jgi:hypothetical protein